MRTLAKTIKKNLFTFLSKVPVSVAVIAIAVFDGLGAAYFLQYSSNIAVIKSFFQEDKFFVIIAGAIGFAAILHAVTVAFERFMQKKHAEI